MGTVGFLQNEDCFLNGGWWHDHRILEATGEGADKEELRAWEGWWNEHIVRVAILHSKYAKLVRLNSSCLAHSKKTP